LKKFKAVLWLCACVLALPMWAQQTASQQFPDNAANHWAYAAIADLADRGLVKGYKDSKAIPMSDLSRIEFASLVNRVLETLDAIASKDKSAPSAKTLTQDTLNQIQALKDAFEEQLKQIQTDLKKAQDDIEALRSDVVDAKEMANKAIKSADSAYGAGNRKFAIGGYIQTRYLMVGDNSGANFPNGAPPSSSSYNGTYMQGTNGESFVIRRSRLKFTGSLTPNTKYAAQIDASGLTNGTNQAVTVREGNLTFTPGDGSAKYPSFTVGLFANPFGYMLPLSGANTYSTEKPLAFNETSAGLFASQDYDRGLQVAYSQGQMKYVAAFVNGSGVGTNDTDRRVDEILRISYQSVDKTLGLGVSFYNGNISFSGALPYVPRKKQLFGIDAQYNSPQGAFILAELVAGTFEQRTYFDQPTLKLSTSAAPDNKVLGYYVQAGYTFDQKGAHPWTIAMSYDVFRRSTDGEADSGSSWDDVNFGIGAAINLDSASRLKLWYISPSKVAHPPAQPSPKKISMITLEYQVKF